MEAYSYDYMWAYDQARAVSKVLPKVLLISLVVFVIAGIAMAAAFLPARKAGQYSGFAKAAYNFFNFNSCWTSPIIKVLYIGVFGACIIGGLYAMFAVTFLAGLVIIVCGLVLRLFCELVMIFINIRGQMVKTNWYLEKITGEKAPETKQDKFGVYRLEQPEQGQPEPKAAARRFCPHCGAKHGADAAFCEHCGKPL